MKTRITFLFFAILASVSFGLSNTAHAAECDTLNQANYYLQNASITIGYATLNYDNFTVDASEEIQAAIYDLDARARQIRCSFAPSNRAAIYTPDVRWSCPNVAGANEALILAMQKSGDQHIRNAYNYLTAELPFCHRR
jgi:hypothetical protein